MNALSLVAASPALARQAAAETELSKSTALADLPEAWIVALVIVPLVAGLAWLAYYRAPLSGRRRAVLMGLRAGVIAVLLLVLARPVRVLEREEVRAPEVWIAVDDSASMLRRDSYVGDARARDRLGELVGGEAAQSTRLDLARAAVVKQLEPELAERGYRVHLYAFATELVPLADASQLAGRGRGTEIGSALASLLESARGRHVTDVVLVSDGRNTAGPEPSEVAATRAAGAPAVHTVLVGDGREPGNARVELAEAPASSLEGDEISIAVRASATGALGTVRASLVLEELTGELAEAPRALDSREVELAPEGRRVVLLAPPGPPDPTARQRRFRVSLPPVSGESLLDDNAIEIDVPVSSVKVRVLYVEAYPRYDYRALALDVLKRSDEHISFQSFLLSATPGFRQESSRDLPPLAAVPTGRRDLLDNYDVVILGDVGPYDVEPDPARAAEFWAALVEFVERGGGLLFQAGEVADPDAWAGTPLEDLLPVVLDPVRASSAWDSTREFRPRLENPGQPHEIVRLLPDLEENRRLWEDEGGLRGSYWYAPVARAKPGAQVLLRHPDPTASNEYGRHPLLVAGYHPAGRTLFLGIDSTHRWLYHYGPTHLERFWRNALRWLALGRVRSGDRRYQLESSRSTFEPGERATVEARVLDQDYRPASAPVQAARWQAPGQGIQELVLTAIEGRAGRYRASLPLERTGLHRVWIEEAGTRVASSEFEVVLPSRENADPTPDAAALRALAAAHGGRAVELPSLEGLWQEFPSGQESRVPISSRLEDAWDHWATMALVLAALATEWILRKRWELA